VYWYKFDRLDHLSVGRSVRVSVHCIVEKWMIGSGCHLGGGLAGSKVRQVDGGRNCPTGRGNFGMDMGRPTVTNGHLLLVI